MNGAYECIEGKAHNKLVGCTLGNSIEIKLKRVEARKPGLPKCIRKQMMQPNNAL